MFRENDSNRIELDYILYLISCSTEIAQFIFIFLLLFFEFWNLLEHVSPFERLRVNPISLSYPFPFVLPLALVPRNRVVSARGENIPL